MITNLKDMMITRLQLFQQRAKTLPQRVLVYRDGVSEVRFLHCEGVYRLFKQDSGTIQHCPGGRASGDFESLPEIRPAKETLSPQADYCHLWQKASH